MKVSNYLLSSFLDNKLTFFTFVSIDEDEVYNNPNLHSEEQDEFEIPDGSSILSIL